MKMVRRFEGRLDTHIRAFCDIARQRSSVPEKPLDFSEHVSYAHGRESFHLFFSSCSSLRPSPRVIENENKIR